MRGQGNSSLFATKMINKLSIGWGQYPGERYVVKHILAVMEATQATETCYSRPFDELLEADDTLLDEVSSDPRTRTNKDVHSVPIKELSPGSL